MLFEKFCSPALYFCATAELGVMASGRCTALAVEAGQSSFAAVPVFEGFSLPHAALSVPVGGAQLTEYLLKVSKYVLWCRVFSSIAKSRLNNTHHPQIMTERGYSRPTTSSLDSVRDIKEKLAYVALNFDQEMRITSSSSSLDMTYKLPDGEVITVGSERFRCAEPLFRPSLLGMDSDGLHETAYNRHDIYVCVCLFCCERLFAVDCAFTCTYRCSHLAAFSPRKASKGAIWTCAGTCTAMSC